MTLSTILYLSPGLIFPLVLGRCFLCLVRSQDIRSQRGEPLLEICFEFGLGTGILIWGLFLLSLAKVPFHVPLPVYALIALTSLGYLFLYCRDLYRFLIGTSSNRLSLFSLVVIIFLCGWASLRFLVEPVHDWDVLFQFLFKAKVFFHDTIGGTDYFNLPSLAYSNSDYPLFLPLLFDWIYSFIGRVDEQYATLFYPLYLFCFFLAFHQTLSSVIEKKRPLLQVVILIITLLYFFTPLFHTSRLFVLQRADFILAFLYLLTMCSTLRFINLGEKEDLAVSFALIGFLGWTKNEGMLLAFIQIVMLAGVFYRKKFKGKAQCGLRDLSAAFLTFGLVYSPWYFFWLHIPGQNTNTDYTGVMASGGLFSTKSMEKLMGFYHIFLNMSDTSNWGLLWYAVLLALILFYRRIFQLGRIYLLFSVIIPLMSFMCFYAIVPEKFGPSIKTVIDLSGIRNFMVFSTSAMLLTGLLVADFLKNPSIPPFSGVSGSRASAAGGALFAVVALTWAAIACPPVLKNMTFYAKNLKRAFPVTAEKKLSFMNTIWYKPYLTVKSEIRPAGGSKVFIETEDLGGARWHIWMANYILYPALAYGRRPELSFDGQDKPETGKWHNLRWLKENGFDYSVFSSPAGGRLVRVEVLNVNPPFHHKKFFVTLTRR